MELVGRRMAGRPPCSSSTASASETRSAIAARAAKARMSHDYSRSSRLRCCEMVHEPSEESSRLITSPQELIARLTVEFPDEQIVGFQQKRPSGPGVRGSDND